MLIPFSTVWLLPFTVLEHTYTLAACDTGSSSSADLELSAYTLGSLHDGAVIGTCTTSHTGHDTRRNMHSTGRYVATEWLQCGACGVTRRQ